MIGSLGIGIGLVIVGLIAAAVLPWAGLVIGPILIVLAVLIILGGFATGRKRTTAPPP
jgi:hypothetical protein